MPEIKIKNEARITTTYAIIRDKFRDQVSTEKNKYPLSAREEMFVDVIIELLNALDCSVRNSHSR